MNTLADEYDAARQRQLVKLANELQAVNAPFMTWEEALDEAAFWIPLCRPQ